MISVPSQRINMRSNARRNVLKQIANYVTAIAVTGISTLIIGCDKGKPQFVSVDVTGADYAKDFSIADHNGQVRTMADFKGKLVVIFFGYTQCPDVCPTTMAEMAEIKKLLGSDGDKFQALFMTVDPERDRPDVLKAYMGNFDPSFVALRPELVALPTLASQFRIFYKKVEGKTPTSYTVDHSAGSYVYDTHGRLRLFTRYGSGAVALASDLKLLLKP
jgi:protein SCO1